MITKIFSVVLIIFVGYGLTVFLAPDISSRIDSTLGLTGLSETLRGKKEQVDVISTDGVNNFFDTANRLGDDARGVVDTTRERIDDVREQANRVQETIGEVQSGVENLRGIIDSTTQSIDDISSPFRSLSGSHSTTRGTSQ